ncbi:MAG: hypothetical protein K0R00_3260 [Herbinix sp.]|nr:hypothetical protein [Herbinix sp.]
MWSEIISNLGSYINYILFTMLVIFLLGFAGIAGVHYIKWQSVTLRFYGVFIGIKREKLIALSLVLIRLLFLWSVVIFSTKLEVTHVLYGALLTIILHILIADLRVLLFDVLYTAAIFGELYSSSLIRTYLTEIQVKGILVAMQIVIVTFILVSTLYCSILCIRGIVGNRDKKLKLNYKGIGQQALLLFTGVLMTLVPYYYLNRVDVQTITQDLYQYSQDGKTVYAGEKTISKSGLTCILENKDQMYELMDTPLYYVNENKILLPTVISIVQPTLSLTNRIANMSYLYEKNGKYYVEDEKTTVKVADFFLYDGRDTYVFFEPITITWEDQTMKLSPFSYIRVKYNQSIEAYNRENDSYITLDTNICNVVTTLGSGTIINLSTDIMSEKNGQEIMLFLQPNLLEDLK